METDNADAAQTFELTNNPPTLVKQNNIIVEVTKRWLQPRSTRGRR
jgi:hypothetical protein